MQKRHLITIKLLMSGCLFLGFLFGYTPKEPNIIKIKTGVTSETQYGVFVLDTNGDLFFWAEDNTSTLVDSEVKDFSFSASRLYILKENGDLLSSEAKLYQRNQELSVLYHNDSAQSVSNSILTMSDGSLLSYQSKNGNWNEIDIQAVYTDAGFWGAGIIDEDGFLWHLDRESGILTLVAENIIDCCYSDRNKVYYSDDIWYITADKTMHLYQTYSEDGRTYDFPTNVVDVSGAMGQYLAVLENGEIVYGNSITPATDVGVCGEHIDMFGIYYSILDENGEIHLGIIQPDGSYTDKLITVQLGE